MKPTALMIDGANLYATSRMLGIEVDFKLLLKHFSDAEILRAFYFTAVQQDRGQVITLQPLIDWLGYNGFNVVTKPLKEFSDQDGRRKIKGNMDVEITVAAMEIAPHISRLVLFSGDGDFRSLVESVQRQGVHVTVVSSIETQPAVCADELRRQADTFIDLDDLREIIGRKASAASKTRGHSSAYAAADLVIENGVVVKNRNGPTGVPAKSVVEHADLERLQSKFAKSPATAPTL